MNLSGRKNAGPDRAAALAQYRRRADVYDLELALFEPIRHEAIERLALQRGQVVLDVGCGTGLSLDRLRQAVGPKGRVIGIEQSPEMIDKARERVRRARWRNVQLVCAPVEAAEVTEAAEHAEPAGRADAALFHFTHDILRRPEAVANILRHLRPGARVVASGLKWARGWARPANLLVLPAALRSVSSLEGLGRPWSHLAEHTGPLVIESRLLGAVYIASGRVAAG